MVKFLKFKIFNPEEDEIDFDIFTKFSLQMFRLLFFKFNPLRESSTLMEKLVFYARLAYYRLSLCACFVAFFLMVAHTVTHSDNLEEAAKSFPNFCSVVLMSLKGFATFIRRDEIWKIFLEFKKMNERRVGKNQTYQVKKYLDDYHFYMIAYTTVFLLISLPVVYPIIPFVIDGSMKYSIQYWWWFDPYQRAIFPFVTLWINFIVYANLMFLLACDSLLYALLTIISMEFDILKSDLLEIGKMKKNERDEKIKDLIDHHNSLLNISGKLQNIYSLTFLLALAISSLILCSVVFQLSIARENLVETYSFYVPYVFLLGGQTYLLCLFGQRLIDSSESVADGIFLCGWEDIDDIKFKKNLILIILRAQRAKRLSAMDFTSIALRSFTTVNY